MDRYRFRVLSGATILAIGLGAAGVQAQEVNLYSARHYDTDVALYDRFTEETGIEVNLIEGTEDELIERIKAEGRNSPADVLITVDAGRLWRADQAGILQPMSSKVPSAKANRLRWVASSSRTSTMPVTETVTAAGTRVSPSQWLSSGAWSRSCWSSIRYGG